MTPGGMGSVDHILGLLALTTGRPEVALQHFQDALAFCHKAGYRPEYAHAAWDYAKVLLNPPAAAHAEPFPERSRRTQDKPFDPAQDRLGEESGRAVPADRARAMSLLDEALAISRDLGMRPLMERVLARRELLNA